MKTLLPTIIITGLCLTNSFALVGTLTLKDKSHKSDAIVRGVVVDIVTVAGQVKDSRGGDENILEGDWSGPSSVAVIRVVSLIKGNAKNINTIIFVPCGYDFDESPCELTKSKDYILFLRSMGHGYYHPLGPFCMHRVQKDIVGMSGFDWKGDFDPKNKNGKSISLEEFTRRVKEALNKKG